MVAGCEGDDHLVLWPDFRRLFWPGLWLGLPAEEVKEAKVPRLLLGSPHGLERGPGMLW